jgi:hypothetical protein
MAWGMLAMTAVAIWLVWPAFTEGRIVNLDAPRHLLRARVMTEQFLPSGHVDGWSPWWYLGAQLFLFQSYGYFFLIGASALLLGPLFSLEQVFKVWYVLPIALLPLATGLLARRLGVSVPGAITAALASIVFTSPLGYGMQGVFGIGLLLQGAGVIGFAFAWPEILAVLVDRDRPIWRAVVVTAAVVLVHFITGAYTLSVAGLVAAGLVVKDRRLWPLFRYVAVAALVLLIAGHSLFPSLELRELAGAGVGWGNDRDRFDRFVVGALFGAPPLALAAIGAAGWAAMRAPRPLAISAIVFFATALAGGSNEQGWEPAVLGKMFEILFRPRALPYAALLQAVFAGVALDLFLRACSLAAASWNRPVLARLGLPLAAAALLAVAVPDLLAHRRYVKTESMVKSPDRRVYLKLVQWLRKNVPPPAVVAVPRTLFPPEALGARSVISLLNLDTGLYTLGGDQAELSRAVKRAGRVNLEELEENPARDASVLRHAGVSHVIVGDPEVRRALAASPDFELVFEFVRERRVAEGRKSDDSNAEPFGVAVLRVKGGGELLRGKGVTVLETRRAPEKIRWTVEVAGDRPVRAVTVAMNWHPSWKAYADGKPIETRATTGRHLSISVPAGTRDLTLEFERRPREKAYDALSAATLFLVAVMWQRTRRRRSSSPPEAERKP